MVPALKIRTGNGYIRVNNIYPSFQNRFFSTKSLAVIGGGVSALSLLEGIERSRPRVANRINEISLISKEPLGPGVAYGENNHSSYLLNTGLNCIGGQNRFTHWLNHTDISLSEKLRCLRLSDTPPRCYVGKYLNWHAESVAFWVTSRNYQQ